MLPARSRSSINIARLLLLFYSAGRAGVGKPRLTYFFQPCLSQSGSYTFVPGSDVETKLRSTDDGKKQSQE